jgi:hypothetical protein
MYLENPPSILTDVKDAKSMLKGAPYALREEENKKKRVFPMPKSLQRRTPICFAPTLQA